MQDREDGIDDAEALDIDGCDVQITRWIDMTPIERAEQAEAAKAELAEVRGDLYVADKVRTSPQGWWGARRDEMGPLAWSRHVAQVEAFVARYCDGVPALVEPYMRLASLRGEPRAHEKALFALAYALGSEGGEVEALNEATAE